MRQSEVQNLILTAPYVKDLLKVAKGMNTIENIELELTKNFETKDLEKAQTSAGQEIQCSHKIRDLWLSETKYVSEISIIVFETVGCRPMDASIQDCEDVETTSTGI